MTKKDPAEDVSGGDTPATGTAKGRKVSGTQVAVGGGLLAVVGAVVTVLMNMGLLQSPQEKMDLEKRFLRLEAKQEEILRAVQEVNTKLDAKVGRDEFHIWRSDAMLANQNPAMPLMLPSL